MEHVVPVCCIDGGLKLCHMLHSLHTVTRILHTPMYSGYNQKSCAVMQLSASLAACSFIGIRTSHVAKLRLQKYFAGMPAVQRSYPKVSLGSPASLLVLRYTPTSGSILGSSICVISRMGKIMFP